MRIFFVIVFLSWSTPALAQTVVKMDLSSAVKLMKNHKLAEGGLILEQLANNYRQFSNVRIQSHDKRNSLAVLAKALRYDFDGSGKDYIANMTIWAITGDAGHLIYLTSSQIDKKAVLLASDMNNIKGMIAFETMQMVREGTLKISQARKRSLDTGIEMQVSENADGDTVISFFGHGTKERIVGKLVVFEPVDFVWD